MILTTSELEKEQIKASVFKDFKERNILKRGYLPYRRGCKAFEEHLGPWREWKLPREKPLRTFGQPEILEPSD